MNMSYISHTCPNIVMLGGVGSMLTMFVHLRLQEIDVVGLPINQIDDFVADNSLLKPPGVLFGALWLKNHLGLP